MVGCEPKRYLVPFRYLEPKRNQVPFGCLDTREALQYDFETFSQSDQVTKWPGHFEAWHFVGFLNQGGQEKGQEGGAAEEEARFGSGSRELVQKFSQCRLTADERMKFLSIGAMDVRDLLFFGKFRAQTRRQNETAG